MTTTARILFLALISCLSLTHAQDAQRNSSPTLQMMAPAAASKASSLTRDNELKIGKSEFWAKPGRIGIFEFDIESLETENAELTFTFLSDEPIKVTSEGIYRDPEYGFIGGTWKGFITSLDGKTKYPLELGITTYAVDSEGNYTPPNKYWLLAERQADKPVKVLPVEALQAATEERIHTAHGYIYIPHLKAKYAISPLDSDRRYSLVYEVDESKSLLVYDEFGPELDSADPKVVESKRRSKAYRRHVEDLKRRIANKKP